MILKTERFTPRSAATDAATILRTPRGGSYVTPTSHAAPGGNRGAGRTEGSYITTPGGGHGNGNRVQGRYVTLAGGYPDDTEGSYVTGS
jgi:hypothetical protein